MMEFKKPKSKCSAAAAVRNRHLCEVLIISCNCYIFFFVLWYSSSMHAWYTIPILITLSCIFLACMLVYISGFMLDCLGSFTFVQNDCFALWYLGTTNSYMQGIGVVDSLIRWNHVRIYMFRLLSTSESTNRLWPFLPVMHNWDYLENCWKYGFS